MKTLTFFLVLISTQLCLAYPNLGDVVQFQKSDGSTLEMKNMGLDTLNQVWLVQVTDGTQLATEKWSVSDMPSNKEVLSVLKNCVQSSGSKEQITVPAGTFETCKFTNDVGGFTWIGDVPFSMVKVVTANLTMELLSFHFSK